MRIHYDLLILVSDKVKFYRGRGPGRWIELTTEFYIIKYWGDLGYTGQLREINHS